MGIRGWPLVRVKAAVLSCVKTKIVHKHDYILSEVNIAGLSRIIVFDHPCFLFVFSLHYTQRTPREQYASFLGHIGEL